MAEVDSADSADGDLNTAASRRSGLADQRRIDQPAARVDGASTLVESRAVV
jgi:hypothetical protein